MGGSGASGEAGLSGDAGAGHAASGAGGDAGASGSAGDGAASCGDVDSDPLNCGACGNVCADGGCWRGLCRQASGGTRLVTGEYPIALAVDADRIYWLNYIRVSLNELPHTQLKSCPLSGCLGNPKLLWDDRQDARRLAVANGAAFWSVADWKTAAVLSCPSNGCSGAPRTVVSLVNDYVDDFVANATSLVFSTHLGIFSCPTSGCEPTGPVALFEQTGLKSNLAIQGNELYGLVDVPDDTKDSGQAPTLFSCPLSGCASGPTLFPTPAVKGALAVSEQTVAWVDTGELIDFSATNMSDTEWDQGRVYACPLTGCVGTPTPLAQYPAWFAAQAIAVDASGVYWTQGPPGEMPGVAPSTLVRCPSGGCVAEPTALATLGTGSTNAIVLDESNVYWIDLAFGAIMKRHK